MFFNTKHRLVQKCAFYTKFKLCLYEYKIIVLVQFLFLLEFHNDARIQYLKTIQFLALKNHPTLQDDFELIKKRVSRVGDTLNCLYCRCLRLSFSRGIQGLGQRLRAKADLNQPIFRGMGPDRILLHCERPALPIVRS